LPAANLAEVAGYNSPASNCLRISGEATGYAPANRVTSGRASAGWVGSCWCVWRTSA